MKQYRKKPVTIEAVQFDGLNPTEIKDFVGENCKVEIYDNEVTPPVARIVIHTLEGDMEVSKGDYVIKGVKGEFYPCKPDIFQQTYESTETQKELEEEMKRFIDAHYHTRFDETLENGNDPLTVFDFEDIARHFAEWGAEHLRDSTKMIDKSLEEAAEEFAEGEWDGVAVDTDGNPLYAQDEIEYAFKAGAEWQKQQMLKDAVEGKIYLGNDYCTYELIASLVGLPRGTYKDGDKVRIIVTKKEGRI